MSLITSRPPATKAAKVDQDAFLGAIWGGVAVSLLFLGIRIFARIKTFKRIFWDDGFVIMAWIPALCTAIDWQVVSKFMYKFILVTSGQVWPPPQNFIHDTERYYKGSMVVLVLFYTSLWSVKISFLLFFKRLAQDLTALRIQWWVIFVFTILSYLACFADTQYWCLVAPLPKIFEKCSTDSAIYWTLFTLKFNCAMDVVTDCLITTIPFAILWQVRIPLTKKLALTGIFSLVVITMVFAILRVTLISKLTKQPDTSWSYMWSSIEQNIAIVVACLASFRILFTQDQRITGGPKYSFREASRNIIGRKKPRGASPGTILTSEAQTKKLIADIGISAPSAKLI
ncbi:hypothetical protein V2W45_1249156 [Cenococcum geophilum]